MFDVKNSSRPSRSARIHIAGQVVLINSANAWIDQVIVLEPLRIVNYGCVSSRQTDVE